jgi:DNA polymerase-3 subunit epsilon
VTTSISPEPQTRDSEDAMVRVNNEFLKRQASSSRPLLSCWCTSCRVIIHNAPFDVSFSEQELELIGQPPLKACGSQSDEQR